MKTNTLISIVLISSLLTNMLLAVVVFKVIQTKAMIEVPLQSLNKVTKELSNDIKDFTIDEVKDSYEDGYIGDKADELKLEVDNRITDYYKKRNDR